MNQNRRKPPQTIHFIPLPFPFGESTRRGIEVRGLKSDLMRSSEKGDEKKLERNCKKEQFTIQTKC